MAFGILIVDDEVTLGRNIAEYFESDGYDTRVAGDGKSALALFDSFTPDVTLLDLRLPDRSGLEILREIRVRSPQALVVMITAYADVQTAVEAMKNGALDYVRKPLVLHELKRLVERAIDAERRAGAMGHLNRGTKQGAGLDAIVGESAPIRELKERLAQLLKAEAAIIRGVAPPVLITGETGSGKELIARAIHFGGPRREQPFIEISCATIPTQLVEGELFGYERGAFTDARARKLGLIEAADGGTLFLDEIGETDLGTQAKLLKVIEDRSVRRIGSLRPRTVDVRFIAATNRDLPTLVKKGEFREDLYFRFNVACFESPPLRTRGEDIVIIAEQFIREISGRFGRKSPHLDAPACAGLQAHPWPGNVRELRNVLEQALLFAEGDVMTLDALALSRKPSSWERTSRASGRGDPDAPEEVTEGDEDERIILQEALAKTGWNVSQAAQILGLSRDQMRYRMTKYGLARSVTGAEDTG